MCVNLYIGGATLKQHYLNMLDDEAAYAYGFNGQSTGLSVSIRQALKSNDWDIITLQQASHESYNADSYFPYIEALIAYVKKYAPKAKLYLHQTWAYPAERRELSAYGFETTEQMFAAIQKAYQAVGEQLAVDGVLLSGEAMLCAYHILRENLYRDTLHASYGFGRYLLGMVWFHTLFGEAENFQHIAKFDAPVTEEEQELAYRLSLQAVQAKNQQSSR